MTVAEDTKARAIKISQLNKKIVEFDSLLEETQELFLEDLKAYESIVTARDHIYRMWEMLHKCDVVALTGGGTT